MVSTTEPRTHHLLLYLITISSILYLLQTLFLYHFPLLEPDVKIKRKANLPLRFNSDGTFKILQVADMHYANGIVSRCKDVFPSEFDFCSDLNTTQFVKRMIDAENPDFIAFTGDNIFGSSTADAAESLVGAFAPAIEAKLPWAAILGNHDQESTMTREELMSFISLMDYSVSQVNPSPYDPSEDKEAGIDGFGNYNLKVHGALGSDLANTSILNLFFLDTGDRETFDGFRVYGWIKESQLRWLRGVSEGFKANKDLHFYSGSGDVIAPALTFFHIPIPEVRQLLWYNTVIGQYQEAIACSSINSGVLTTLVSMGDVKAVFMGHDHINDFCGNINSIWFCYGGGTGYHAYGRAGWRRRARVILVELEKGKKAWMGVRRIKTWKHLDDASLSKIDEQILWDRRSDFQAG